MSKMRRYIIQPFNFGSTDGYGWEDDTGDPEDNVAAFAAAHHDYCALYSRDYSVRVWEPGRHSISQPGVLNAGTGGDQFKAPELPMKVTIHGIKGAAYFRFDGSKQGVGTWWYVSPGEDGGFFQYPVQPDWRDTYNALNGNPMATYLGTFANYTSANGIGQDLNPGFKMPLFCTLYRGTYKQLDAASGWEIDTGPNDDPDTLIGMNITNPSVLESERIHWWDMDMVQLPSSRQDNEVTDTDVVRMLYTHQPTHTLHKYALNLSENHRLRPDQVLWLHWATGMVRMPVALPDQAGGTGAPTLTCAFYRDHKFSVSVQASMLATATVAT